MDVPFSVEQFMEVFRNYNEFVFPVQIFFYVLGFIAIYFVFHPTPWSGLFISSFLAFLWLWMGVVYHLLFFTAINKAAYLFAVIFLIQRVLFLITGSFQKKFSFRFRSDTYSITGLMLVIFALVIYPVIGYFLGHRFPYSPTFGLPCPTTIFTFGLLLLNTQRSTIGIFIIPFTWSVLGLSAALQLGIMEDLSLLAAGIITFLILLVKNKKHVHS